MSKATYLDQIEAKIAAHQQTVDALLGEIEKLKNAAEVIAQLRGNDGGGPVVDVTPPPKSGAITIRKITGPGREKPPRQQSQVIPAMEMKPLLIEGLKAFPAGVRAAELGKHINMGSDAEQKRIWYVLSVLRKDNKVRKDADGLYTLVNINASAG